MILRLTNLHNLPQKVLHLKVHHMSFLIQVDHQVILVPSLHFPPSLSPLRAYFPLMLQARSAPLLLLQMSSLRYAQLSINRLVET